MIYFFEKLLVNLFKSIELGFVPAAKTRLLKVFYEKMKLIRRFEEAAAKAYATKKIKGFCHLYIGEESVAVGAIATLESRDYIISTYREHGHALARGLDPKAVMAELYGKETGCSKGLGGSMHLFDREKNFMGGHGIVGGHVAVGTGIAYASRYNKERAVTLCFLGEGAINIGGFHEGLSLAALWSLPIVFIIENNLYAMGTPLYRSQRREDLSQKALTYGINRNRIDAANVYDVYDAIKDAVNHARAEKGPTLIEAITYRFRGHSMSDPAKYRTNEELEERKQQDPIKITYEELLKNGVSEEELKAVDDKAKKEVTEAVEFAEKSDFPSLSMLHQYTYQKQL